MKILVVDDKLETLDPLMVSLKNTGYVIESVNTYKKGEILALSNQYQLIFMAHRLCEFNRISHMRNRGFIQPIVVLVESLTDDTMISVLDAGVDEVLSIDLDQTLFISKVKSLLRRTSKRYQRSYSLGSIVFEPENGIIRKGKDIISLTNMEIKLMEYFYYNQNITLSKTKLMAVLWGNKDCVDNNLEVYISYLRKKIKQLDSSVVILTKRRLGYTLTIESKS
ncbi:MAG: response regulator transcription factor [Clostridiales bacterium]|nr:response regulator transcription factor [Clostridiales bacterium]